MAGTAFPDQSRSSLLRGAIRLSLLYAVASGLGGCSFAIPSLGPDPDEVTGSIAPVRKELTLDPGLDGEDVRRARGALAIALDPQGNGRSMRWDNPESGAHGAITPDGGPYVENDLVCRRFLATVGYKGGEGRSVRGSACKPTADEWELRTVVPWRKPG